MATFSMRALEMHSGYVWNYDRVCASLDFIRRQEMTALVLHRNDIVDLVVYPGRLFGSSTAARNIFERYKDIFRKLYKYTPTRRSGPYQRRDYLKRVIELARRQGIEVYFQNKELFFPDILLELYPDLTHGGTVCPTHPFWRDFLEIKYTELFEDLPALTGIITAPGTGESRVAISSNRCACERCRSTRPQDWYRDMILAMHGPIKAAGATLAVRDFVFDRKTQNELAETIEALPGDIAVSLKNTPHDYYPTFPINPRIGEVGKRRQWLEFDTMGQYFGWGVGPAILIDDFRWRMTDAAAKGADGVILRTDWESLDGHSVFDMPNLVNLYAGAALGHDLKAPASSIYRTWLTDRGLVDPTASEEAVGEAEDWVERLLGRSWEVVRRSLFVNDCVFSDSSNYPVSLDHAWWLAEEKNSLKDWVPEKADALSTDEANVRRILAEKDEALAILDEIAPVLRERPAALTQATWDWLVSSYQAFRLYVRGWRSIVRACILTRAITDPAPSASAAFRAEAADLLQAELDVLDDLAGEFRAYEEASDHRFVVYAMLGWERIQVLRADLSERLEQAALSPIRAAPMQREVTA
jgi:hypothetical protein